MSDYTVNTTEIAIPRKISGITLTAFARALYGDDNVHCAYSRVDKEWLLHGDGLETQSMGANKTEAKRFLMDILDTIDVTEDELDAPAQPVAPKTQTSNHTQLQINGKKLDIIPTPDLNKAINLVQDTMSRQFARIGLITGDPGTGKTIASYHIAATFNGSRICCYPGMTKKDLAIQISSAAGHTNPKGSYGHLINWIKDKVDGQLFLIDEANHITWQHMELLRYLTDEAGATVILFGTRLLTQAFQDRRTATLLAQLTSRIGAKNITFAPIPASDNGLKQIESYFIRPFFGNINKKAIARAFQKATKGYWRLCRELTEACQLLMEREGFQHLTKDIVEAAGSFLTKTV